MKSLIIGKAEKTMHEQKSTLHKIIKVVKIILIIILILALLFVALCFYNDRNGNRWKKKNFTESDYKTISSVFSIDDPFTINELIYCPQTDIDTVKQLREKYGRLDGTVLHSDRGCQYTSYAFRRELVTNGLIQSLSGTAHCYDNARMESFFATLKKEKLYQIPTYRMKREEVKTVIFRYIFGYYNTQRINSFNEGGLPPVALRTSKQLSHHAA